MLIAKCMHGTANMWVALYSGPHKTNKIYEKPRKMTRHKVLRKSSTLRP